MAGIYIDMEAFLKRMVDDFNELFGPMGIFIDSVLVMQPRRSFWQRLKGEIASRPRVF